MSAVRLFPAKRLAAVLLLGVFAGALGACQATVNQRGYLRQDSGRFETVRVGVDTKDSVALNLGSPTNKTILGDETWYYISETQEDFLFFRPETVARRIIAVTFGPDGRVARVDPLTDQDGVQIAIADAETPTRGRELSLLQQLLGSIGRGAPVGTGEQDTGRDRR
jgi:outer membrane protein assembly factor BamE (lipoprotein component of BamABCDE complex)